MPIAMQCPFFGKEKDGRLYCEGAVIKFKGDKMMRDEYIGKYCANLNGWLSCPHAQSLIRKYERDEYDA